MHRITLIDHAHSYQFMEWHNLGITTLKHAICSPIFLKIFGKPNNYQFYLLKSLKFCDNISYKLLRSSQWLEKSMEILELSTLQKQIRPLHTYSMLEHIERVAITKLTPRNCLRYLQATLVTGVGRQRSWYQKLCEVLQVMLFSFICL